MFIKRIEIFGFKSFAEKTVLELSRGTTAVVGPNGCGKSNVADAISWVLGESNIRNLRGQRATDVIFGGSEKRKALSMAEVSLTLDNSCGSLPINFSEVTVTRRTFRSGEAEYFINKTRCRLKDIYELFLDTGMGREAYSMLSQGEIDAVLSAKPEDRRELFEEAAGIKKYRHRRSEATRKLERTEANLQRVRDIMAEIDNQLAPLQGQAEQAMRFNELQERLSQIEIGLLIRDLRKSTELLAQLREDKQGVDAKLENYDTLLAELDAAKDAQADKLQALEEEVEDARRIHTNLSGNVQRLETKMQLLVERLSSAENSKGRTAEEIALLERKIEETRERIDKLRTEEAACAQDELRVKMASDAKSESLAQLDKRFEEINRDVNDQKAIYLELAKELAAKRNALQNSCERVVQLEAALKKYDQEIANLNILKQESETRASEAAQETVLLESKIGDLDSQIAQLRTERKEAESAASELATKSSELARQLAGCSSRLGTLREMAEAYEGFYEGVRSVMAARKQNKIAGAYAVVADVISVPKGYEAAVDTALGSSVQDVITDSVAEAKQAIAFLKANRAGRATFLPLDDMRSSTSEVRGRMDSRSGALGIAADLVGYDPKYTPAIRSLLGRTVIAENIDSAVALSRQLSGWRNIVTLEGELISPSGAITGGVGKNRGPGLLLRKQEMDTLTQDIVRLETEAASVLKKQELTQKRLSDVRAKAADSDKSLSECRIALAETQRKADFAGKENDRIARQLDLLSVERDEAETLRSQEAANADRLSEELKAAGKEDTDLEGKVAGTQQDIEELDKRRTDERDELMRLNIELASCSEHTLSLKKARVDSQSALEDLVGSLESRRGQSDEMSIEASAIIEERERIEAECERQRTLFTAADARLSQLTQKRSGELEASADIDTRLRGAGRERNQLAEEIHEADVREARLEVQVSQAAQRLLEEYEVTEEQALAWPDEVEVERGTVTEVARLRREIKDMGPVNTGAVQEYERIKERWDFLTEQRADLENARDQINSAIGEIDENTRGLFMETYNAVSKNFEQVFTRLFDGGRAELSLTDPNNLLETGINVTVQPPGKKLQDLELLSGGERALTATALVFALLMARPSPFVVMDEVDAPLDESNVERFAQILKDFAATTQFIVITHNRASMEAADSLYGVTMQEPGISKLISVKLSAEESVQDQLSTGELATV